MPDDISLLPNELRDKEGKAKRKAKEASAKPQFKMHFPEEKKQNGNDQSSPLENSDALGIEIGIEALPKGKKGVFQIVKKEEIVKKDGKGREVIKEVVDQKPAPEINLMWKNFAASRKHHVLFKIMILIISVALFLAIAMIMAFYVAAFL